MKRLSKAILLGGLLVTFVSGCSGKEKDKPDKQESSSIHMMLNSELSSLNTSAILNTPDAIIHTGVFEGLYELNEKEELVPAAAKEMPEISKDGLTYTIKLREDGKWSNGDPVTAKDFEFAWKELIKPENAYVYSFLMSETIKNAAEINLGEKPVEELGVKALDDYTLEVVLKEPKPFFTSLLAFSAFFPQHQETVETYKKEYGTSSEKAVYNGPYTIKDWDQAKTTFVLEKNKDYWNKEVVKVDTIQFEVIKEPSTAFNLFESGQLDVANLSGEMANQNKDNPNFKAYPSATMNYIRLNQERQQKKTPLANLNLRKALALSVDKETLVNNIIADGSTVLNGAITKDFVSNPVTNKDFREEAGDVSVYNLDEAKKYFEKAKAELGDKISLELMTVDESSYQKMAESLQGQWQDNLNGLTVTVKSLPTETALNLSTESDYDMFLIYWTPDYQDPISTLNTMKSPNNRHYVSKEFDAALNEAAVTYANDLEKRWSSLIEAEKILMEDTAGMISLSQNANAVLQNPDIEGLSYHTFASPISLKYLSKK
ncbi:peptide ABC transporter substrate-binding protein [Vagococcus sp. DIV0080]|uniref:Peptide ABC transporter substrate-binding protein n=1 Tax=Candidatus Vagococcus giribetii TaxID=2230876 RepID=A0ABS3HTX3_9ENTE|nr:peptide ABC transporter substrate-binding protein [Vagococcus sp. DIV0080]MBO0476687.1 peptide ABC transporter substrate-binding protein [Vagococcus sp. DIV0080]